MSAAFDRVPQLEKYELLEELGHGGMATVYRARDRRLGREVAVKIIHHHLRENREVATRFASEARAVAKVKHPSIVEVYDVSDIDSDERYLVVELVRGKTLRQLLTEQGPLPPEVACVIGIEIALGLDHAHGLGVIHRDVKPENVLLATPTERERGQGDVREGLVKITDFGIAKLLDAQGVTSTGQVLGSPAHMAPEQIEGGEVSARSDVFGLGVLLYEALVGKLPFDGKNPAQVLRRVLEGVFTPVERARPTVGAQLGAIVDRALAKEPRDRFASAGEVAQALAAELAALAFEDPALELAQYLRAPKPYSEAFESRIVGLLVRRGKAANLARDVRLAVACFNRALSYRPDDAELVSQVSSLARGERTRRVALRFGGLVLGGALLALGVGVWANVGAKLGSSKPGETLQAKPSGALKAPGPAPANSAAAPAAPVPEASALKPARRGKPARPVAEAAEPEPEFAPIQVVLTGPQSATVLVDGRPIEWFGQQKSLSVGEHTFEFRPPDGECCVGPVVKTVQVLAPGSAGEVQKVQGVIEWKPATLEFRGAVGESASCGEMGRFPAPGARSIPMQKAALAFKCTAFPPPQSAEAPKEFDVELRPGRTSSFPRL